MGRDIEEKLEKEQDREEWKMGNNIQRKILVNKRHSGQCLN